MPNRVHHHVQAELALRSGDYLLRNSRFELKWFFECLFGSSRQKLPHLLHCFRFQGKCRRNVADGSERLEIAHLFSKEPLRKAERPRVDVPNQFTYVFRSGNISRDQGRTGIVFEELLQRAAVAW